MQDAGGYSFEEAGRTLELSSPACGGGRKRASGRAVWQGVTGTRDGHLPRPSLTEGRFEEGRISCP